MKHYGEFETNLPAILEAADIEPAELGFFDRANFMDQFLQRGAALTSTDHFELAAATNLAEDRPR